MKLKAFFRLLLCSVALFSFVACSDDEEDEFIIDPTASSFVGDLIVDQNDGTSYTDKNLRITIDFDFANQVATLSFYQVKFAERMPIRLDMTVSGVKYIASSTEIRISGNKLVPFAMGGPFEEYTITDLVGRITPTEMIFSMTCGEFPVSYVGKMQ